MFVTNSNFYSKFHYQGVVADPYEMSAVTQDSVLCTGSVGLHAFSLPASGKCALTEVFFAEKLGDCSK